MLKPRSTAVRFQAIDPWKSEGLVITRRILPHFEVPNATYFVTFRCRMDVTLSPAARDAVIAAIQACDGVSIDLDAAIVMPNHAHAIFRIVGAHKLGQVLQRIKGRSAKQINQLRKAVGAVWVDESFDHIIRNETELEEKIEYIRQNPVKSGLVARCDEYPWLLVKDLPESETD